MMNMERTASQYLPNLPIYQKAIEILALSRRIADYLTDGKNDWHIPDDHPVCFAGDMITYSSKLAPNIEAAETQENQFSRYRHMMLLKKFTNRLVRQSERLERQTIDGKDYVALLRNELKKFKRLQLLWESSFK